MLEFTGALFCKRNQLINAIKLMWRAYAKIKCERGEGERGEVVLISRCNNHITILPPPVFTKI